MISIIIVHYHVKKELFVCLDSLYSSKTKMPFEIIVVDNDEKKEIHHDLKKQFPQVRYLVNRNNGYGEGNNVGAAHAKGKTLFFLNPDTKVYQKTLDILFAFLHEQKHVGIVAPLLLGKNGKPYQQGAKELTPLTGIFSLSFIHKLFPNNPIAKKYYLSDWERKSNKEVAVVPGTALMMKKSLFKKIGGFDEKFFLYFEEFDLCKRVGKLGKRLFIIADAKASHTWGASTKKRKDINKIFSQSRFYYFKKHFGFLSAFFLEAVFRFSKYTAVLLGIIALGAFLRIHTISETMPFIGDQGWFYLSARDMVVTGNIPLVGIESSRPWLHQGALWTYLLAISFQLFSFSPLIGAYLSILFGLLSIVGMFVLGKTLFSNRIGLIAAAFFAISPLIIVSDRMPYHTSPIPFFTILFFICLYKWIKGSAFFFPLCILLLGILYQLEIATALLGIFTIVILLYGFIKKKNWALSIFNKKIFLISQFSFIISMLPMLIYDFHHGFPQTLGFIAWLVYKVLVLFGYPPLNPTTPVAWSELFGFFGEQIQRLVFPYSGFVSYFIFVLSFVFVFYLLLRSLFYRSDKKEALVIVFFVNVFLLFGFFLARTPSSAYFPMLFPGIILLLAISVDRLFVLKKVVAFALIGLLFLYNIYFLITNQYAFVKNSATLPRALETTKQIVNMAEGKSYTIRGIVNSSYHKHFSKQYEYLAWLLGKSPTDTHPEVIITVKDAYGTVQVTKSVNKL